MGDASEHARDELRAMREEMSAAIASIPAAIAKAMSEFFGDGESAPGEPHEPAPVEHEPSE